MLEHRFQTLQRLPGPIVADQVEHPMFDGVPLGSTSRIVCDHNRQPKLVSKALQARLPHQAPIAIRPATVGFDQQMSAVRINLAADSHPPAANRGDGKLWRVVRETNDDLSFIASHIIDTIRDGAAFGSTRKVIHFDSARRRPPLRARLLEVADQFFLLGIDTNDRPFPAQKCLAAFSQIAELLRRAQRLACRLAACC